MRGSRGESRQKYETLEAYKAIPGDRCAVLATCRTMNEGVTPGETHCILFMSPKYGQAAVTQAALRGIKIFDASRDERLFVLLPLTVTLPKQTLQDQGALEAAIKAQVVKEKAWRSMLVTLMELKFGTLEDASIEVRLREGSRAGQREASEDGAHLPRVMLDVDCDVLQGLSFSAEDLRRVSRNLGSFVEMKMLDQEAQRVLQEEHRAKLAEFVRKPTRGCYDEVRGFVGTNSCKVGQLWDYYQQNWPIYKRNATRLHGRTAYRLTEEDMQRWEDTIPWLRDRLAAQSRRRSRVEAQDSPRSKRPQAASS